jgi:hypothetical protein
LQLAQLHGWKPQGTNLITDIQSDYEELIESYYPKDGQVVSKNDAKELAKALTDALEDIPNHDAVAHKTEMHIRNGKEVRVVKPNVRFNLFEAFSGDNKKLVKDFVWFCNQGAFEIW